MITVSKRDIKSYRTLRLLKKNKRRSGAVIYNDSSVAVYIGLGFRATSDSWSLRLLPHSLYELPSGYNGTLYSYCPVRTNGSVGSVRITEFNHDR